eukprot:gnl/MRDRNA2_/MRDRNA2_148438_c0_seq1.p1 gnl/MRDRNA2_/MRDRNA2_148438_c0~~gnl/MRDRNA2_/MRDRNA2_148438_c0_seq1.p1  ORF type:complete len:344 (+),score=45.03 gnl/MRDRNA2_/MRDRNA2_148438_c0_seq1:2-1033(+)
MALAPDSVEMSTLPNFRLSDWMGDLQEHLGPQIMPNVILPGSHDAGSFSLTTKEVAPFAPGCTKSRFAFLWSPVTGPWAKTQRDDYKSMLENGCRYLDTRVCYDEKRDLIRTEHSLMGFAIEELFQQVKQFVDAHPKEIVVVHLRHFRFQDYYDMPAEQHIKLLEMIPKSFDNDILVHENEWNLPMQELWAKGRKVLVMYAHKVQEVYQSYQYVVPRTRINGELWCNAQSVQELEDKLDEFLGKCEGLQAFFKLEACITPDTGLIVRGILSGIFYPIFRRAWCPLFRPKAIHEIAAMVAPNLEEWVTKKKTEGHRINIVSFDDFSVVGIARNLITLNTTKDKE